MFWILLFIAVFSFRGFGAETEAIYLEKTLLPAVRTFARRNALELAPDFKTNAINDYRISFTTNENGVRADGRVRIADRFAFSIVSERGVDEIDSFQVVKPSILQVMNSGDFGRMREVSILTNHLNTSSALLLGKKYFRLQGHREANFHRPFLRQLSWGDEKTDPKSFVKLPYYSIEWIRKDMKDMPMDEQHTIVPSVQITVSGVTSNLEFYGRCLLPVGRDNE